VPPRHSRMGVLTVYDNLKRYESAEH